jgi:hypothetical protein
MKTVTLLIHPDGSVSSLYDDMLLKLCLGPAQVKRASFVEYENGEWVARRASARGAGGGEVIARGKTRAEVVAQEIAVLTAELESGH